MSRRSPTALAPFEQIVTEHGPMVMRICTAILRSTDAEDAWVDTFVSALRAYPSLAPESNVRGWLATIAHNRAIDHLRRVQRQPVPTEASVLDRAVAEQVDSVDHDALREALDTLAPKQRSAVVYRYIADLPYAEIARLLECSEAAARRSASDGIAKLRRHLPQRPSGRNPT